MTEMPEHDATERMEARYAIADLVHEYARLVRRDMPEAVSDLFVADAVFEIRDGHPDKSDHSVRERLEGAEAIRDYLLPGKGKPHPIPLIHNLMIELHGDRATANSVMEAQVYGTDHAVFGEYHDTFRRVAGRWLFASRTYTIYGAASSI